MRRLGYGLVAGLAAAAVVLAVRGSYPLRAAELKAYDARVRALADPSGADTSIVIAWNSEIAKPTTSDVTRIGAESLNATTMVEKAMSRMLLSVIAAPTRSSR